MQISVRPATTPFRAPTGTSSTEATRTLAKPRLQLRLDQLTRLLEGDAVEDLAEKALHEHPLGRPRRDAPGLQIEQVVGVDRSDRGAVSASDVVVVDLEHGNARGPRLVGEDEVSVRLVCVRASGALLDADESRVDGARHVLQRALEEQVRGGVAHLVGLQRVEVEELFAGREVDALQLRGRALSDERRFDAGLREPRAQGDVEELQ